MNAPVFSATYSDFKLVKTRGVVQVIFEVPLAESNAVLKILGGMPDVAAEKWFGIAPLDPKLMGSEVMPNGKSPVRKLETAPAADPPKPRAHQGWNEMSPAQQAGILCADKAFQQFLYELGLLSDKHEEIAKVAVRQYCEVDSRTEIKPGSFAATRWSGLVSDYRAWMREPSMVPA